MNILSAAQLRERLARPDAPVLVDVLPRVSFDRAHLPGAEHASFYDDDFLQRIEALVDGRDTAIVVYCVSSGCNASARAAAALVEAGYTAVHDFEGGIRAWREAGFPVVGAGA